MAESATSKALDKVTATAKKAGNSIVKNPTGSLYVVGGILAIILAYKAYNLISDALGGGDDKDAGGGNIDPTNPGNTPVGASINVTQAQTAAANLLSAMDGFGRVEKSEFDAIKRIFQGRNIKDYALISQAFGMPRRSIFTGEESTAWLGGEKLNLTQWLSLELNEAQKAELAALLPDVF